MLDNYDICKILVTNPLTTPHILTIIDINYDVVIIN